MYGVVHAPSHTGDKNQDDPFDLMCFLDPDTPVNPLVQMQNVLIVDVWECDPATFQPSPQPAKRGQMAGY